MFAVKSTLFVLNINYHEQAMNLFETMSIAKRKTHAKNNSTVMKYFLRAETRKSRKTFYKYHNKSRQKKVCAWSEIRLCGMGFMASLMQAVTCFKDDMMRCDLYDIFNKCMAGGLLGAAVKSNGGYATWIRKYKILIKHGVMKRQQTKKRTPRGKSSEILTDV